jgi:hypothetical protein
MKVKAKGMPPMMPTALQPEEAEAVVEFLLGVSRVMMPLPTGRLARPLKEGVCCRCLVVGRKQIERWGHIRLCLKT